MTTKQFLTALEEFYGKSYNHTQVMILGKWCKGRQAALSRVFDDLIESYDGRFRLPLVVELNAALANSRPAGAAQLAATERKQITDDAGWTEEEMDEALNKFKSIAGRVAAKRKLPEVE